VIEYRIHSRALLATLLALTLMAGAATAQHTGLIEYVQTEDPSFQWELTQTQELDGVTVHTLALTSQTWRGIPWTHWLTVFRPKEVKNPKSAFLFIAGGNLGSDAPRLDRTEHRVLTQVATVTGSVAAVLNQVPNQPLFGDLHEDALISYTYEKFLAEGGDWPLLFPMAKSAAKAMDAVQQVIAREHGQEITEFMTAGGSKRGWTTWLSAVADPRVKRIAPMIIDMLNTPAQMRHQLATYGGYTESIGDYTERGIQDRMLAGEGEALLSQVDPYSWRDKLTLPKLVVLGTNDPYWTVDAANLYFDDLKGEKHLYYQANTGHDANFGGIATITEFYNSLVTGAPFPSIQWENNAEGQIAVRWEKAGGSASLWTATSPNRDFRDVVWTQTALEGDGNAVATLEAPAEGWAACYVEVNWPGIVGMPFGLTTQMTVLPDSFPNEGTRAYDQPRATE
jgi:PhoPQ-activated pathogenicity-related protein